MTPEAAKNIALQKKQAIEAAELKVQLAKDDLKAAEQALAVAKKENK